MYYKSTSKGGQLQTMHIAILKEIFNKNVLLFKKKKKTKNSKK